MQETIIKSLRAHKTMTTTQLSEELDMSRNTVTRKLRALVKSGMARRERFINPQNHFQYKFSARRK